MFGASNAAPSVAPRAAPAAPHSGPRPCHSGPWASPQWTWAWPRWQWASAERAATRAASKDLSCPIEEVKEVKSRKTSRPTQSLDKSHPGDPFPSIQSYFTNAWREEREVWHKT